MRKKPPLKTFLFLLFVIIYLYYNLLIDYLGLNNIKSQYYNETAIMRLMSQDGYHVID